MTARPYSRKGRITIAQAASELNVSRKTLRNLLSEHRAAFGARVYGMSRHGRVRLLSPADVARLERLLHCWGAS
jgi:predicted DNA-binding protein (UPF0251 family)